MGFLYAAILVLALPPKWTQVSKNDILEPPPRRLRPLDVERSKQTIAQAQGTSVQSCSKVLGHFCISGAFSNSPMSSPSPPPPPPTLTNNVGRMNPEFFSEFQLCMGWGEGELQDNFDKDVPFYEGTQK